MITARYQTLGAPPPLLLGRFVPDEEPPLELELLEDELLEEEELDELEEEELELLDELELLLEPTVTASGVLTMDSPAAFPMTTE
jgi:hypothetical protein